MLGKLYASWMYRWETALTTRDENRVVRPVEWGFDWLTTPGAVGWLTKIAAEMATSTTAGGRSAD